MFKLAVLKIGDQNSSHKSLNWFNSTVSSVKEATAFICNHVLLVEWCQKRFHCQSTKQSLWPCTTIHNTTLSKNKLSSKAVTSYMSERSFRFLSINVWQNSLEDHFGLSKMAAKISKNIAWQQFIKFAKTYRSNLYIQPQKCLLWQKNHFYDFSAVQVISERLELREENHNLHNSEIK